VAIKKIQNLIKLQRKMDVVKERPSKKDKKEERAPSHIKEPSRELD